MSNPIVTNTGLSSISKRLINARSFDKSLITVVGNPEISNTGVAEDFGYSSYVQYNSLSFNPTNKVSIRFYGTYMLNETTVPYQCMYSLKNSSGYDNLDLIVYPNEIRFNKGGGTLILLSDLTISEGDLIDITIEFTSTNYSVLFIQNESYHRYSGSLKYPINVASYIAVDIGSTDADRNCYWQGSINLDKFIINVNKELYYTPSVRGYLKLSKILASDGSIPLSDDSIPIRNHIQELSFDELSRSANIILIKASTAGASAINIAQLGLYAETENGNILFAIIEGLAIKKSTNLSYNLVIKISMELEVVNTIAYPEIVIPDDNQVNLEEFGDIKEVHAKWVTDLERVIVQNASIIGYGRDLTLFNRENTISTISNNCIGTNKYFKLSNHPFESRATLEDFYWFVSTPYHSYKVNNLSGLEDSSINVLDTSLTGTNDNIDFNSDNGMSLYVKANIVDESDKCILSKYNEANEEVYFAIELYKLKLRVKIYYGDKIVELSGQYNENTIKDLLENNLSIVITSSKSDNNVEYNFYLNHELFESTLVSSADALQANEYSLANYTNTVDSSGIYVNAIMSFKGALGVNDIKLIDTLLEVPSL